MTGANEIAKRARGTPRIAGRLLRRVRDFAIVEGLDTVTRALADKSLQLLDVDPAGLDVMDRKYLTLVATSFSGGPVGIETIAAALSEPRDAIEEINRTLPDPERLRAAHPARTDSHPPRLPASRHAGTTATGRFGGTIRRATGPVRLRGRPFRHLITTGRAESGA